MGLLFTFAQPQQKMPQPSPIRLYFLPLDPATHPMLHEYKKKRAASPSAKASHGVVISQAQPRLVQKLGRRIPVRL
jgi:hypothetical protein